MNGKKLFSSKFKVLLIVGIFLLSMMPMNTSASTPFTLGSSALRDPTLTAAGYIYLSSVEKLEKGEGPQVYVNFQIHEDNTPIYIMINVRGNSYTDYYTWTKPHYLGMFNKGSYSRAWNVGWYFLDYWNDAPYAFGQGSYSSTAIGMNTQPNTSGDYQQGSIGNPNYVVRVLQPTMLRIVQYDSSVATSSSKNVAFFENEFNEADDRFVFGTVSMDFRNLFLQHQWTGNPSTTYIPNCDSYLLKNNLRNGFASVSPGGSWGRAQLTGEPGEYHKGLTFKTNRGWDYMFGVTNRFCQFAQTDFGIAAHEVGYHVGGEWIYGMSANNWDNAIQHEIGHALGAGHVSILNYVMTNPDYFTSSYYAGKTAWDTIDAGGGNWEKIFGHILYDDYFSQDPVTPYFQY